MKSNWKYRTIWDELENLRNQMGQAFTEAFDTGRDDVTCTTYPFLDVLEKNGELWVKVELPGMSKDKVHLHIEDNVLTISGEIEKEESEDNQYIRNERFFGKFKRNIRTNYQVDSEKIGAEMQDGLLTVYLPKHQRAKAKTININID